MRAGSVWLGPLRKPARMAMLVAVALAIAGSIWLILGAIFFGTGVTMQTMLRPAGNPAVLFTLWTFFASVLLAAIYLSDTVGQIEPRPRGPMDVISLVCGRLAMIGVVGVVLVMFYEVIARYVFEKPTLWANEFSLWLAGFIFLLAGLYAMQQRSHIRIYIIYDVMPRWAQKTADIVSLLLIWAFTAAMIWGGFNEAWDKLLRWETFGTAWDPPIPGTLKPAILGIITLVAIQALSNLIADWNLAPESHSPMDEIDQSDIENLRRTLEKK